MAQSALVGVIMGSRSDLRVMTHAVDLLTELDIPHEVRVVSAHRTPDWMLEYARTAEGRGLELIIAAARMLASILRDCPTVGRLNSVLRRC